MKKTDYQLLWDLLTKKRNSLEELELLIKNKENIDIEIYESQLAVLNGILTGLEYQINALQEILKK